MSRLQILRTADLRSRLLKLLFVPSLLAMIAPTTYAAPAVTTYHNDNARSGANLEENLLNTSNVNAQQFGKLFEQDVDDDVFSQVLYVPNLNIPGKGKHNVMFVATANDSVYAFDADNNLGANADPLWQANFTDPASGITAVPVDQLEQRGANNLRPGGNVGIMGTPVIDRATRTMYLVARTYENGTYVQKLHALNIRTGAEKFGGPVTIRAGVAGSGNESQNGIVRFNDQLHNQRAGLALSNGTVYISWASHVDAGKYHGWMMAYDARSLQRVGVFNVTPNGAQGGIWQSGQPPVIDADGNVYVATGNGTNNALTLATDYGQSVLRLTPRSLQVADWFTPDTWELFNVTDYDLNSSGPLFIPDANRLISAGKDGQMYVLNSANLGQLSTGNVNTVQVLNSNTAKFLFGSPVYYNSPTQGRLVYFWPPNETLQAHAFNGSRLGTSPAMVASSVPANVNFPGGFLSVSSNGALSGTGIVWAYLPLDEETVSKIRPGMLRAFDASNLSNELWNSTTRADRDSVGDFSKFVPPTVAKGRVYVPTLSRKLVVYGLLNPAAYQFGILRTRVAGSGTGRVVNLATNGTCSQNCVERIRANRLVVLNAVPGNGSSFVRWGGACRNRVNPCRIRVKGNVAVRAIFR